MPYPPESSWNLPPTAEQIRSINKAGRILGKEEITEKNMPETRWQARELMMEWWAEVRDKPRVKSALILMSNPGESLISHSIYGEWIYAKVGSTEMRGKKGPSGIEFEQVSDTYDRNELQKAVEEIERKIEGGHSIHGEPESEPLRKMRGELIRLKTDIEKEAPELETIYREAMEASVGRAKLCDLFGALDDYEFGRDTGHIIEHRLGADYSNRFMMVEKLAKLALIEALNQYCQCQIPREEEE